MEILLLAIICIGVLVIILLLLTAKSVNHLPQLQTKVAELHLSLAKIEDSLRHDFRTNREENTGIATANRTELNNTLKDLKVELFTTLNSVSEQNRMALKEINITLADKVEALISKTDVNSKTGRESLVAALKDFTLEQRTKFNELKTEQQELTIAITGQLEKITAKVEGKLTALIEQNKADNAVMREALVTVFKGFGETFDKNVNGFNELQREKFGHLEKAQRDMIANTETRLESIRTTVEEKLEKTLSERLGQSFETVGKQLIEVQKGLGEMQALAQDVGGLKKVLSNVKMRGGFGEVQLHMLLENILAPEQYEANVATKPGSIDRVEFAVKFPNKDGERDFVWLPIDAKFPKDAYEHLQTAYDTGDLILIEQAQKGLETVIKKMAADICNKYIDTPHTTNFGIMFLPFEGLFAEVVRKASLLETLQRDCNVIITGPTTLAVILNSLQMGFRTLAIQKRSSEVWQVLGTVKAEFEKFGGLLEKAQKNIQTGLGQLDDLAGTRTRAIKRQLRNVEALPVAETAPVLPELIAEITEDEI